MYLICNFSIKPLACVVFDPDCLKKSYGVNHTVESVDKVVWQDYESYRNLETKLSPRPVYRYQLSNFLVSGKLVPCVYFILFLGFF